MITNTELEQLIHLINPPGLTEKEDADFITLTRHTVYHISRELLCARELIKSLSDYDHRPSLRNVTKLREKRIAYDALCAPQEKTGEVK